MDEDRTSSIQILGMKDCEIMKIVMVRYRTNCDNTHITSGNAHLSHCYVLDIAAVVLEFEI